MNKYLFSEPRKYDALRNGMFRCYFNEEITEQSDIDLYELSGNTLKLTSQQNQEDVPDFMKEITFTRVG